MTQIIFPVLEPRNLDATGQAFGDAQMHDPTAFNGCNGPGIGIEPNVLYSFLGSHPGGSTDPGPICVIGIGRWNRCGGSVPTRAAFRFAIAGAPLPAPGKTVKFRFWHVAAGITNPDGAVVGGPHEVSLELIGDVPFIFGPLGTSRAPVVGETYFLPALVSYGTVITASQADGPVEIDVTTQFTAARNAGWSAFVLRMQAVTDPGGDFLKMVGSAESQQPLYVPLLIIDDEPAAPQTISPTILTFDLLALEPKCVEITGKVLRAIRDRQEFDWDPAHRITLVRRGNQVRIEVSILDTSARPADWVDPTTVTITLRNASGTAVLTNQAMTKVDVGTYMHVYTTQATDALGLYTAEVEIT